MRRVIVNSTPIIVLSNINRLDILKALYGQIIIPQAVFDEVTAKSDSACYQIANHSDWIIVEQIINFDQKRMYQTRLHAGEVEVMILAQQNPKADLIILDDNTAKKTAKFLGLTVTGTLGVLVKAKKDGIIKFVAPIIDDLINNGFYITDDIRRMVLDNAGEF